MRKAQSTGRGSVEGEQNLADRISVIAHSMACLDAFARVDDMSPSAVLAEKWVQS